MKQFAAVVFGSLALLATSGFAQNVHVDLSGQFDRDAFVTGEEGSGDPLDEDAGWIDANSLPDGFTAGEPYSADGEIPSYLFADLSNGGADSVSVNNQSLSVPVGNYAQINLALLAPSAFIDLSKNLQLNYADGSTEEVRFGPFGGMFDSPIRHFDQMVEFIDDSEVETYFDITPQQNDQDYLVEITGSANQERPDFRFVDASAELIYEFDLPDDVENATMNIDMQNNFVVELTADFGFTWNQVLNAQEMFGEDIHDGSNRDVYSVDLAPTLAELPENILWVRFTDGSPDDGWGPSIYGIDIFSGQAQEFQAEPMAALDTSNGEVHADVRTDGGENEQQYIHQLRGTQISNVGHRFADGTSQVTYRFDLPNDLSQAAAWINMEANFQVSLTNNFPLETLVQFQPGSERDQDYIVENTAQDAGSYRFVDAESRLMYQFDLSDDVVNAELNIDMENNFVVSVGPSESELTEEFNSQEMFGEDFHDASNRDVYTLDLTPYLDGNSSNELYVLFQDGSPSDGWGPAVRNLSITTGEEPEFTSVLTATEATADSTFGYNQTNTLNKKYYNVDFTSYLENNDENEVYMRFQDPTTDDGWGPGIFRIVTYSGEVVPQTNSLVMNGLQPTGTVPENVYPWGLNLFETAYPLDASKQLEFVTLPAVSEEQEVLLFAATLVEDGGTSVQSWSLY